MTVQRINPGEEPANITQGILVSGEHQTLYISGQVGADAQGKTAPDFAAQCRQAWANVQAVLAASGMGIENIVKTGIFLTEPAQFTVFAEIRKEFLRGHKPASTLVYVTALNKPQWKVEIEAIAVKHACNGGEGATAAKR